MKKNHRSTACRRAFSLVEMLIVITIIAVLASLLFAVSKRAINNAKTAKCAGNLKQIYYYLQNYAQDHNGQMPVGIPDPPSRLPGYKGPTLLLAALEPYVTDRRVFYCPSHYKGNGQLNTYSDQQWKSGSFSYYYFHLWTDKRNNELPSHRNLDPNMSLLLSDPFDNTTLNPVAIPNLHMGGFNILRLNGAVEFTKNKTDIDIYANPSL